MKGQNVVQPYHLIWIYPFWTVPNTLLLVMQVHILLGEILILPSMLLLYRILWWSCSGWCIDSCKRYFIQYSEQESMYTKFLSSKTGNISWAASRDHELVMSHRGTALHISHNVFESCKFNHNYIENSSSSSTTDMEVSSSDLSNPCNLNCNAKRRCPGLIKTTVRNTIKMKL